MAHELITLLKNLVDGDLYETSDQYESKLIDGKKFIVVWPKPLPGMKRRPGLMAADSLTKVK